MIGSTFRQASPARSVTWRKITRIVVQQISRCTENFFSFALKRQFSGCSVLQKDLSVIQLNKFLEVPDYTIITHWLARGQTCAEWILLVASEQPNMLKDIYLAMLYGTATYLVSAELAANLRCLMNAAALKCVQGLLYELFFYSVTEPPSAIDLKYRSSIMPGQPSLLHINS